MIHIQNLHAQIEEQPILKGLNLFMKPGEVHAIMGPNGAGKSTLANVLAGREGYTVTEGSISLDGEDLGDASPEERAHKGLFLAFQYPVEIPGVSTVQFLKTAVNESRKARGETPYDAMEFLEILKEKMALVKMREEFMKRALNEGFSGGEKKRNEILQMAMLDPRVAILDETDSGLDIDSLRIVAEGVNTLRTSENAFLVITHYQRLLEYIVPDHVHVMYDGQIIASGDKELAHKLEKEGYDWVIAAHKAK